jgi:hypothetical protein
VKKKSSCERLLDRQNSIVKKEKSSCEGLPDSQKSIVKKRRVFQKRLRESLNPIHKRILSGIHPGYSCKEGRRVEDGLLVEFPCTPTRTRSV